MKRLSALLERCKLWFELLLMGIMAYVFTNYLDGDIGVVVWSFFLIAPLLSAALAYAARKNISVRMEAPDYLAKGSVFRAEISAETESRLPVPFLRCSLQTSANLVQEDARPVQSAMTSQEKLHIPTVITAKYAGLGEITMPELTICDYLGLFRFSLPDALPSVRVGVIPVIPELTGAGSILHAVSDEVLTQEEEEETAAAFSAKSMPGYIHREYVPGDSLRRINWKMSAKRQKLMVRMDESAASTQPAVLLDLQPEEQEEALRNREIMMEGALGFLLLLVKQGIPCTLRFASGKQWKILSLMQEEDVRNAAIEIAAADFQYDQHRTDTLAEEKAGAYLIYTTNPDEMLAAELGSLKDKGYVCAVCPAGVQAAALAQLDSLWELGSDFVMKSLKK